MTPRYRRLWLAAGLLLWLTPALAALVGAQQEELVCPDDHTCLDYEGVRIEFDPDDGPYQVVIVADVKTVTTTIADETTTDRAVIAAGFALGDDGRFTFDREWQLPRTGVLRDAEAGDSLILGE